MRDYRVGTTNCIWNASLKTQNHIKLIMQVITRPGGRRTALASRNNKAKLKLLVASLTVLNTEQTNENHSRTPCPRTATFNTCLFSSVSFPSFSPLLILHYIPSRPHFVIEPSESLLWTRRSSADEEDCMLRMSKKQLTVNICRIYILVSQYYGYRVIISRELNKKTINSDKRSRIEDIEEDIFWMV